jgi:serine/threonine-protein kinase
VQRLLGSGAVGTVYAAEHIETNKRVALKCVDASHALDPAAAERLVREAQAAARIRHPNVVDIYDVGREGKLLFLVMEYLEGEPLSAVLMRRELPTHKLVALLLPAMRGVAEAHRQGVVHRDIKPENVFLASQVDVREPVAKVLDFGISKLDARGSALRSLTADGYAIGTPGYMAYEQALAEKTIDGRADVYAFGAILYEALTGMVPHSGEDFPSLVKHFVTQRVATPIEAGAKVPQALSALVMWAIERDREQRVSSMESLIRELEPFASESQCRAETAAPTTPPTPRRALGGTLVGPWGVGELNALRAATALGVTKLAGAPQSTSQSTPAMHRATTLGPTTVEAVLWLKRMRVKRLRSAALFAGLALLVIIAVGLSLKVRSPRASQLAAAQASKPRVASPAAAPTVVSPSPVSAPAGSDLPSPPTPPVASVHLPAAQPLQLPAAEPGPEPMRPPAQLEGPSAPRQIASTPARAPGAGVKPVTAAAPPARSAPVPVAPKPAAAPPKPASKARDFGIY